jgi:hypothetical protein
VVSPLPFPSLEWAPTPLGTRPPFTTHVPSILLPVSFLNLHSLALISADLRLHSLTTSHKPMASPLSSHPARSHFCSWAIMAPIAFNGLLFKHSWLLRLSLSFFVWFIRSLVLHPGWFFSSVLSVRALLSFSLCLTCLLGACSPSLLPNLHTNMWRRSRAPCSCPNCISEELREQFRAL